MGNLEGVFKYGEPRGRNKEGRSLSGNEEMGEPRKSENQEGLLVSIKKVSRLHMYLCVLAYAHI